MRKLFTRGALTLPALVACLTVAPPRTAAAVTLANWDAAHQRQVVRAGMMQNLGASFEGAAPLTTAQANAAMVALTPRAAALAGDQPGATGQPMHTAQITGGPVTVVRFDALVIDQLGLADVAAHVQAVAGAAGLLPPAYFGTEVVARYLGLRYDHPSGHRPARAFPDRPDHPGRGGLVAGPGTRLRQLGRGGRAREPHVLRAPSAERQAAPGATDRGVAHRLAVRVGRRVGTAEPASWMYGPQAHGGFDCSGFVWRVFKLSGLPWGQAIGGRTAA
jgi:cell wall-associated NlpC family hydrolase